MTNSPFDAQNILESARQIRPELSMLLPPGQAQSMDQQLAHLLARAKSGEAVDTAILDLLKANPQTYDWLVEFLSPGRLSKGPGLLGRPGNVSVPRYVCPEGDYVWFRRTSGQPVPRCPSHGELVLDEANRDAN